MDLYTAHVTPVDGIARRIELRAPDLAAARAAVLAEATALFGRGFTYCVRPA